MLDFFLNALPDALTGWQVLLLVVMAGFTSYMTASVGIGGGVLLLAVLSLVMPVAAIIPVHGMVQLGSNANRALMLWRHISWRSVLFFLPGALLGAALAAVFLVQLPLPVLQLAIASFILYLVWGPKLPKLMLSDWGTLVAGGLTTFLSHFVGATGRWWQPLSSKNTQMTARYPLPPSPRPWCYSMARRRLCMALRGLFSKSGCCWLP